MRRGTFVRPLAVCGAVLLLPLLGFAQEATLSGTVKDVTGGVLPGVVARAVHEATGNSFETVTDETGAYRLAVRVGTYRITAELPGFATVAHRVEVLVGRDAVVNLVMSPATLQEAVTVSAEAPLIDTTGSTVGANIDPRQMEELPVQGRNWMDLSLLAPGARRNESGGLVQNRYGYTQTLVDGQEITVQYHSSTDAEQVQFSRDAIAEFQVISNLFDATIGRSAGMVVTAVTKSGTNTFTGTAAGYFRDDKFKAADFVAKRVLPYANQQMVVTFGGPIRRDRAHFFGSYEYEREPKTFAYTTPYPSMNRDVQHTDWTHKPMGRLDYQFTPRVRLSLRFSAFYREFGQGGSATQSYGNFRTRGRRANQYFISFPQVLSNRSLNEINIGAARYERLDNTIIRWKGGAFPYRPALDGAPVVIQMRGLTVGGATNPLNIFQNTWTVRDNFTTSYEWGGRHDLKLGGEYMRFINDFKWCLRCMGIVDARGGPVPANLAEIFPDILDASTWNLQPLSRITRRVVHIISNTEHQYGVTRNNWGAWVQDDWKVADRLTLNLGLRYDWDSNGHSERLVFLPWLPGDTPRDKNNFAPRLGVNYQLSDRTALRGGFGVFYSFAPNDGVQETKGYTVRFENEIVNDGRPDFVPNWFGSGPSPEGQWGGPKPTFEQALARACDQNHSAPGCVYRSLTGAMQYPGRDTPRSYQASVGVQQQVGAEVSVEVNYTYTGGRKEPRGRKVNLTYNPATGANYPFSDISRRAFPDWGQVNFEYLAGTSNYHGLNFVFTKRFSQRWQANGSYTLSYFADDDALPRQWFVGADGVVASRPIGFPLAPDVGGEYTAAASDQRHRANVNWIWDLGYGFQVSGIYFFGSGERFATTTGLDLRNVGTGSGRLRPDGAIMPRNDIVGEPLHRVDVRLQKRLSLGGHRAISGVLEVFNLFNHVNYGSYVTDESSPVYSEPSYNENVAYQPRTLQLGVRATF